jgi:hypothetical protein
MSESSDSKVIATFSEADMEIVRRYVTQCDECATKIGVARLEIMKLESLMVRKIETLTREKEQVLNDFAKKYGIDVSAGVSLDYETGEVKTVE